MFNLRLSSFWCVNTTLFIPNTHTHYLLLRTTVHTRSHRKEQLCFVLFLRQHFCLVGLCGDALLKTKASVTHTTQRALPPSSQSTLTMMTSGHLAAGRYRYRPASASSTSSTTSLASADSGTMFATLFNAIKAPFTTMTAASAPPTATSSSATSAAAAAAAASSKAASSHTGPASAPAPPLPCETILNSYEM